jgi:hypothetical protein
MPVSFSLDRSLPICVALVRRWTRGASFQVRHFRGSDAAAIREPITNDLDFLRNRARASGGRDLAIRRGAKAVEFEAIATAYALARRNPLDNGHPLTQTHDERELGPREFRAPFLERELLSDNPLGLPYTWLWSETISAISDYPPELILRHLQSI